MNNEQIQAEIEAIKAARADKGGRMSNEEKAQIQHLEAMLNIPQEEDVSEETEETTEEVPASGGVMVETLVDSLCIPSGISTRMVPAKGAMVEVPKWFADKFAEQVKAV